MPARLVPCLGFVAPSGMGKTTLLRRLVPLLCARGLRLGYLKHAHHGFDLDTPGKDSYELRRAGAARVLIASAARWALLAENVASPPPSLDALLARFDAEALDLVLIEGFRAGPHPRIEVRRGTPAVPGDVAEDAQRIAIATDAVTAPVAGAPPWLPLDAPEAIAAFVCSCLAEGRLARADPRAALRRACRRLARADAAPGAVSWRHGDWFTLHTTAAATAFTWALADELPAGAPSAARWHQAIHRHRPQAGAVVSAASVHAVAMSLTERPFQPRDEAGAEQFPLVPTVPTAAAHTDTVARLAAALGAAPVALVAGAGAYAWGETVSVAYARWHALERSARIALLARGLGQAPATDGLM